MEDEDEDESVLSSYLCPSVVSVRALLRSIRMYPRFSVFAAQQFCSGRITDNLFLLGVPFNARAGFEAIIASLTVDVER